MYNNEWTGSGTVYNIGFKHTSKGKLWMSFSIGVYNSFKKETLYLNAKCFDESICLDLQDIIKDKDYVKIIGSIDVNKTDSNTYTNILVEKIYHYGQLTDYKNAPKIIYGKQPVVKMESDDVPF